MIMQKCFLPKTLTSFANYPLSFVSTTRAKKKKNSVIKQSPQSSASFPVVLGSFGYYVTCQTFRQPRSQVSLLREKGSERTLGERLACRESSCYRAQFQASSITRIRRELP